MNVIISTEFFLLNLQNTLVWPTGGAQSPFTKNKHLESISSTTKSFSDYGAIFKTQTLENPIYKYYFNCFYSTEENNFGHLAKEF